MGPLGEVAGMESGVSVGGSVGVGGRGSGDPPMSFALLTRGVEVGVGEVGVMGLVVGAGLGVGVGLA